MKRTVFGSIISCCLGFLILTSCEVEIDPGGGDTGIVTTASDTKVINHLHPNLAVLDYTILRGKEVITGTVLNNSDEPLVDIEIAFDLFYTDSSRVGTVAERTSELKPGDTWDFTIDLPADQFVAGAVPVSLNGTPVE